jgi:hypothetical protein
MSAGAAIAIIFVILAFIVLLNDVTASPDEGKLAIIGVIAAVIFALALGAN